MSIISHFQNAVTQRFLPLFGVPTPSFGAPRGDIAHIGDNFRVDSQRHVFIGGKEADEKASSKALNHLRRGLLVGLGAGAVGGLLLAHLPFVTLAASALAAGAVMTKMIGPGDQLCSKIAGFFGAKDTGSIYVRGAVAVGAAVGAFMVAPFVFPAVCGVAGGSLGLGMAAQQAAKDFS